MLAITQGVPRPRNTFTELLPVTFPTDASAYFSFTAAVLLANKSGRLVPRATNKMAVASDLSPTKQPNTVAKSPTMAVTRPIIAKATTNVNQPPSQVQGGTIAKITCKKGIIDRFKYESCLKLKKKELRLDSFMGDPHKRRKTKVQNAYNLKGRARRI